MGGGWETSVPRLEDLPFKGDTVLGNDVWVGERVTFLPGARVGDGGIIGAGAVVAGNVPAYAVAVGNPCRVVRMRFDEETVPPPAQVALVGLAGRAHFRKPCGARQRGHIGASGPGALIAPEGPDACGAAEPRRGRVCPWRTHAAEARQAGKCKRITAPVESRGGMFLRRARVGAAAIRPLPRWPTSFFCAGYAWGRSARKLLPTRREPFAPGTRGAAGREPHESPRRFRLRRACVWPQLPSEVTDIPIGFCAGRAWGRTIAGESADLSENFCAGAQDAALAASGARFANGARRVCGPARFHMLFKRFFT